MDNKEVERLAMERARSLGISDALDPAHMWRIAMTLGGTVYCEGFDLNDVDSNYTPHNSVFHFLPAQAGQRAVLRGSMNYAAGSSYNDAEAAPILGTFASTGLSGPPSPQAGYTKFVALDEVAFSQAYHGGQSTFFFSGKTHGARLVGKYKMAGRSATGIWVCNAVAYEPLRIAAPAVVDDAAQAVENENA